MLKEELHQKCPPQLSYSVCVCVRRTLQIYEHTNKRPRQSDARKFLLFLENIGTSVFLNVI